MFQSCDHKCAFFESQCIQCTAVAVSPCNPNPCQHGGTCASVNATSFKCFCQQNYTGKYCARSNRRLISLCHDNSVWFWCLQCGDAVDLTWGTDTMLVNKTRVPCCIVFSLRLWSGGKRTEKCSLWGRKVMGAMVSKMSKVALTNVDFFTLYHTVFVNF